MHSRELHLPACVLRGFRAVIAGETCHAKEPGFFRICYSAAPVDAVLEGIRRIVLHLEKTKAAHSTLEQGIVH